MITKTLKEEAKKEAIKLRENATKEELAQLSFKELDAFDPCWCIYGQISGDCYNLRATELLNLCAVPYSSGKDMGDGIKTKDNLSFFPHLRSVFSPIEVLLIQDNTSINSNLIAYLRSETDEFNF